MQPQQPDRNDGDGLDKNQPKRPDESTDAQKSGSNSASLHSFSFPPCAREWLPRAESPEGLRQVQWKLNDEFETVFKIKPGESAERFLEVFNVDALHEYLHQRLGHSGQTPINQMHVIDSQQKFMDLLCKLTPVFVEAGPTVRQLSRFFHIPYKLKLNSKALEEYLPSPSTDEKPHGMTAYYWKKAAGFVYKAVIPGIKTQRDLTTLFEVEFPACDNDDFESAQYSGLCAAVERGLEITDEDPGWIGRIRGFEHLAASCSVEHPLGLVKEVILDPLEKSEPVRISNLIKVITSNRLQNRLLAGTNGGETTFKKIDEVLRQPVFKETPEDSIQDLVTWHRSFLFKYLLGRQHAGRPLPLPEDTAERKKLIDAAEKTGYEVALMDKTFTLIPHKIENYGSSFRSIASNLRKRLRQADYKTAAEFINHFDPARLPQIEKVPYQDYTEPSEANKREWQIQELVTTVFFEELLRQLPQLDTLDPSARQVRQLLELQNQVPDFRYNLQARTAHDMMMWGLFDRYLGSAKSIRDWTTIITYRTQPAAEFERQQVAAYNRHLWKAVALGDEALKWTAYEVWTNGFRGNQFNPVNTLKIAFDDLPLEERRDAAMIPRAIQLIQGGFLREQAHEKLADDPINNFRIMLASFALGIPQSEFDPKHVDPKQLEAVEKYQKTALLNYLVARQSAGAPITVPTRILPGFIKNAKSLGFEVTLGSNRPDATDDAVIQLEPKDPSSSLFAQTKKLVATAISAPFKWLAYANTARKRGWW